LDAAGIIIFFIGMALRIVAFFAENENLFTAARFVFYFILKTKQKTFANLLLSLFKDYIVR
jgi:hypothetical protein